MHFRSLFSKHFLGHSLNDAALARVYKIRPVGSASLDMRMGWRQFLVCPNRLGSALSWRVAL
jgi:hypothetical protein